MKPKVKHIVEIDCKLRELSKRKRNSFLNNLDKFLLAFVLLVTSYLSLKAGIDVKSIWSSLSIAILQILVVVLLVENWAKKVENNKYDYFIFVLKQKFSDLTTGFCIFLRDSFKESSYNKTTDEWHISITSTVKLIEEISQSDHLELQYIEGDPNLINSYLLRLDSIKTQLQELSLLFQSLSPTFDLFLACYPLLYKSIMNFEILEKNIESYPTTKKINNFITFFGYFNQFCKCFIEEMQKLGFNEL